MDYISEQLGGLKTGWPARLKGLWSVEKSSFMPIATILPKRLILGPILLYIFINDLHDEIPSARLWMIPFRMTSTGWRNGLYFGLTWINARCPPKLLYHSPSSGYAEKLWMPPPWKCSGPGWMELWATWSSGRCPCSWQRGWNQMVLKIPSNP